MDHHNESGTLSAYSCFHIFLDAFLLPSVNFASRFLRFFELRVLVSNTRLGLGPTAGSHGDIGVKSDDDVDSSRLFNAAAYSSLILRILVFFAFFL